MGCAYIAVFYTFLVHKALYKALHYKFRPAPESHVRLLWLINDYYIVVCLQLSEIINEFVECQGKCWTIAQSNPQAIRREDPHNISCDNDRSKPLKQPPMVLTWPQLARSVTLLWNFFYYFEARNTGQPRAAPALVWSNVLYPDSKDKELKLGVRRKK